MIMMESLVSCLCVTEDRPAFLPWLLWAFDRQTFPNKELVIVDSSERPYAGEGRTDVRVLHAPRGESVPAKRNLALDAARGAVIAWFDDDDWQHPLRLALSVPLLSGCCAAAGPVASWVLDLWTERAWRYPGFGSNALFNGSVFAAEPARAVSFDQRRRRASDTVWMSEFVRRYGPVQRVLSVASTFLWIHHGNNLSISPVRRELCRVLEPATHSAVKAALGEPTWSDTETRLEDLKSRLADGRARAPIGRRA